MSIQKAVIQKTIEPALQASKSEKSLSFRYFIQEGDRYYHQHCDWAEGENQLEEALNAYSQAQEQAPNAPEVLIRMAKVFYLQGHYDKAERYIAKVLKTNIQTAGDIKLFREIRKEAYTLSALMERQRGQTLQACWTLIKAVRLGGLQSREARLELYQTCQALFQENSFWAGFRLLPYAGLGAYALLTAALLAPIQKHRQPLGYKFYLIPQICLAWLQEETGSSDGALHRYLDIHHHFPGLASIRVLIGCSYRNKGQFEQARHWFESAIERHPTSLLAYCHLAQLYEYREAYLEMADVYRRLVKLQPGNPHVWCNLANATYFGQAYREALTCYETALHLSKNKHWKAMVAQSIANIYADAMQNNDAAMAYYQMAQDLDPSDVENYIQKGLLYFQKEAYDNAEQTYLAACSIAPQNARLYSNLGYLRWTAGDTDSAIAFYEKAIKLDDNYEIPLNNLGVIYLDTLGQVQRAIETFKKALTINDNYALAHYNMGRAYSFLNRRMEAATCFRAAQDINQFSKELDNDELTARINNLFDTYELRDAG